MSTENGTWLKSRPIKSLLAASLSFIRRSFLFFFFIYKANFYKGVFTLHLLQLIILIIANVRPYAECSQATWNIPFNKLYRTQPQSNSS